MARSIQSIIESGQLDIVNPFADNAHVAQSVDDSVRLLLLCSRPRLDENEFCALIDLTNRSHICWPKFIKACAANFVVNLAFKHLCVDPRVRVPSEIRAKLVEMKREAVIRQMALFRTQRFLINESLIPLGIAHAFLKGIHLSETYYGDIFLRQCRDIDILVASAEIPRLSAHLLMRGYSVKNEVWSSMRRQSLSALAEYSAAVELESRDQIVVELHRNLDTSGTIFRATDVLDSVILTDQLGLEVRVPVFPRHYLYLLAHHSRHRWESLHWTADLAALKVHRAEWASQVCELAAKLGLSSTMFEAELLGENLKEIGCTGGVTSAVSLFLPDCLGSLYRSMQTGELSPAPEVDLRAPEPDFAYEWQKDWRYRLHFLMRRVRPTLDDYNWHPLPPYLWWVYYFTKPVRIMLRRLSFSASAG